MSRAISFKDAEIEALERWVDGLRRTEESAFTELRSVHVKLNRIHASQAEYDCRRFTASVFHNTPDPATTQDRGDAA